MSPSSLLAPSLPWLLSDGQTGGRQSPLVRPEPAETLPDVPLVLPVLQLRLAQLLPPGGDLHGPGTLQTAGPVLEGDAGVAEVRILEGEHFETGARLVAGLGTVGAQLRTHGWSDKYL